MKRRSWNDPKRQKAQRGAVSVLVVITMLMLIVFGLLALTSAMAFERLGRKAVLWAGEYYELDSVATEYVQIIDESLFFAEKSARDYMNNRMYLSPSAPLDIPQAAQDVIALRFGTAQRNVDKERALENIFERLYFYFSVKELKKLSQTNDFFDITLSEPFSSEDNFLVQWDKAPEAGDVLINFIATEGEGEGFKNISIGLAVEPADVSLQLSGGGVSGGRKRENLRRYRVVAWREWQKDLTMRDTPFWDGTFETLPDIGSQPNASGEFEIDDTLPTD